jgi:hypothetical protein
VFFIWKAAGWTSAGEYISSSFPSTVIYNSVYIVHDCFTMFNILDFSWPKKSEYVRAFSHFSVIIKLLMVVDLSWNSLTENNRRSLKKRRTVVFTECYQMRKIIPWITTKEPSRTVCARIHTQNSLGLIKLQDTFDNMNEDYVFPFFYISSYSLPLTNLIPGYLFLQQILKNLPRSI